MLNLRPPNDGEPAFPSEDPVFTGMSLRAYLVGQALAGGGLDTGRDRQRASRAVFIADQCIELLGMGKEALERCQEILR